MDFGFWVEPEMVNPESELYRVHPDWAIHFPMRARTETRNQLILNMAREDVQDYLISVMDKLLSENKIAFIKWDMNRHVSEPGWENGSGDAREIWVRYVYGLYRVWGTLRERHPHVIWQSCASSGGRADLGILRLAAQCIRLYKEIQHIVQLGDQYRLISSQKNPFSAVQYVSKDKTESVLFVFRVHIPDFANVVKLLRVYLRGLESDTLYSIEGFDEPRSGKAWMESGLKVELRNMQSKILRIRKILPVY
jgi:alpha-galactosidase